MVNRYGDAGPKDSRADDQVARQVVIKQGEGAVRRQSWSVLKIPKSDIHPLG